MPAGGSTAAAPRRRRKSTASRPLIAPARLADLGRSLFSPGSVRPVEASPAQRNRAALEALAHCSDPATRAVLRHALVRNNLPLVRSIAARMGRSTALPREDLEQVASLGLLRAIDAFRPELGRSFSSFAVPYIRGAIQHELRDRCSLMRIPRELWELRRRASALQEQRQRQGLPGLGAQQLAAALDCDVSKVVEALALAGVTEMRSLDAPLAGGDDGSPRTLLEALADPASLADPDGDSRAMPAVSSAGHLRLVQGATAGVSQPAAGALQADEPGACAAAAGRLESGESRPDVSWLQHSLARLEPLQRQLLEGHVCIGSSWVELGRELGLHPRQAQRLTVSLLSRLREEGLRWRQARLQEVGLQAPEAIAEA